MSKGTGSESSSSPHAASSTGTCSSLKFTILVPLPVPSVASGIREQHAAQSAYTNSSWCETGGQQGDLKCFLFVCLLFSESTAVGDFWFVLYSAAGRRLPTCLRAGVLVSKMGFALWGARMKRRWSFWAFRERYKLRQCWRTKRPANGLQAVLVHANGVFLVWLWFLRGPLVAEGKWFEMLLPLPSKDTLHQGQLRGASPALL